MKKLITVLAMLGLSAGALVIDAPSVAAAPACRVTRAAEVRSMNWAPNHTIPRAWTDYNPNTKWPSWLMDDSTYRAKVNGNYTGSTDEIIQWAACKWSIPVDLIRAVAAQESWWDATTIGDQGESASIMQVKSSALSHPDTRAAAKSTAWAVDYWAATYRACFDGKMKLWRDRPDLTSRRYTKGDQWGCVEAWYSGVGPTAWSAWYPARVQQYMGQQRWRAADFIAWTGWQAWCRSVSPAEGAGYWNCIAKVGS